MGLVVNKVKSIHKILMFGLVWKVWLPGGGEQGEELQPGAPVPVLASGPGGHVLAGCPGRNPRKPVLVWFGKLS
jgi:hypothetical protein